MAIVDNSNLVPNIPSFSPFSKSMWTTNQGMSSSVQVASTCSVRCCRLSHRRCLRSLQPQTQTATSYNKSSSEREGFDAASSGHLSQAYRSLYGDSKYHPPGVYISYCARLEQSTRSVAELHSLCSKKA